MLVIFIIQTVYRKCGMSLVVKDIEGDTEK